MKAWGPGLGTSSPFWHSHGVELIAVEYDDGRLEWRAVSTGTVFKGIGCPGVWHQTREIPSEYIPEWYRAMDIYGMDIGL